MNTRLLSCAVAALLSLCLGGCKSPVTVSGKVITGDLSFIAIVDAADPRLGKDGLADAEISARGVEGRSDRILTDGRSGKTGDFKLRIEDTEALTLPAMFHAHLGGYADARQELAIPPSDRRILVILKPLGPGATAK